MALISYTNKVALNENPEIADINKVTDDDLNEIKSVVNENFTNEITISDTEPTSESCKLWIDTGEVGESFTEITNEYSTSTGKGYSANYINGELGAINTSLGTKSKIVEISSSGVYRVILGAYSPFIMYGIWNTTHFFGYFGMSGSSVVQKFLGTGTPTITFTYVSNGAFDMTLPSASDVCILATPNLSVIKL